LRSWNEPPADPSFFWGNCRTWTAPERHGAKNPMKNNMKECSQRLNAWRAKKQTKLT